MTATAQTQAPSLRGLGWGVFFMGFVPGLLQFQLGQKRRAAIAFLSCTALYFVGWAFLRDRLFYFAVVTPETTGAIPAGRTLGIVATLARLGIPTILPEILNLPANAIGAIQSFDSSFDAQRLWRLPRPMEDLAAFLTAASGYLAAFWSADGHWGMRLRRDGPALPAPAAPVCSPALA